MKLKASFTTKQTSSLGGNFWCLEGFKACIAVFQAQRGSDACEFTAAAEPAQDLLPTEFVNTVQDGWRARPPTWGTGTPNKQNRKVGWELGNSGKKWPSRIIYAYELSKNTLTKRFLIWKGGGDVPSPASEGTVFISPLYEKEKKGLQLCWIGKKQEADEVRCLRGGGWRVGNFAGSVQKDCKISGFLSQPPRAWV